MAFKPRPNFDGSIFYLHDIVLINRTHEAGIITGFDYKSKVPKHIVTFNYSKPDEYIRSCEDYELSLLKRNERIIEGLKRYEQMTAENR